MNGVVVPEGESLSVSANQPPVANTNGPYEGNEGSPITFSGGGSHDPDGTIASVSWDFGDGNIVSGTDLNPSPIYQDNGVHTVILTVTDDGGPVTTDAAAVTASNVVPTVGALTAPLDPLPEGTTVTVSAGFTDPGVLDTHTAVWAWDDESTSDGVVDETNSSGTVKGVTPTLKLVSIPLP